MATYRSGPYLTKYEVAALIGQRADQIAKGAIPLVAVSPGDTAQEIARREVYGRRPEIKVVRVMPDGSKESIPLDRLRLPPS